MNNLGSDGCAGGVRCKAPVAQHGHSLQATGNAALRPPVQSECPGYSWTVAFLFWASFSSLLDELRFQLHRADAVDLAINVVIAIDQSDVFHLGADLDHQR